MFLAKRFCVIVCVVMALAGCAHHRVLSEHEQALTWQQAMQEKLKEYAVYSRQQLAPYFVKAGVAYPPQQLAFLIFKDKKQLQLYARDRDQDAWRFIKSYRIYAASGGPGPKLKEGDRQVPEGIYHIIALNPRSRFDLSMQLDYPNNFDRTEAQADHRADLGGNIFIHGENLSVGCIAIGDQAIQELFPLVYEVGEHHIVVVISPDDLRRHAPLSGKVRVSWLPVLYTDIQQELKQFPVHA